jgi:membrane protein YdbS with pleckstrin-like domain
MTTLTEEERETLKLRERLDDQDGVRLNSLMWVLIGVVELVFSIALQHWWWAFFSAVWTMAWGAVFIVARRRERRLEQFLSRAAES